MKRRLAFWMYETALKWHPPIKDAVQAALNETARQAAVMGFNQGRMALLQHQARARQAARLQ